MIRTFSKALTIAAGLAMVASVALAGVPDATQSTVDGDLMIGNARGLGIAALPNVRATIPGGYLVTVRDAGTTPLPGISVSMNFTGSNIKADATQTGGQVGSCAANTITLVTNASGQVNFLPATVGVNSSLSGNVQIRANGVLLTTIKFHSIDLIPVGGGGLSKVNASDLNAFRTRFLNLPAGSNLDPACDYASENISAGKVDASDLNVFRTEFLAAAAVTQTECP